MTANPQIDRSHNRDIWQKDHDHFVHPWTMFDSFKTDGSLVMARANGAYVYDADGKRYLDGIGGLWCVNIGYGRDEIGEAIAEQAKRLAFFNPFVDTTNIPAAELAALVAELAPGSLKRVFFSSGGSTANDTAYRLIQYYQNCRGRHSKKHIIARKGSYHGSTYIAMSIGGKKADHVPEFDYKTDTIHHVSSPNVYRRPEGQSEQEFCDALVEELEAKILELGPDNVAAFFAEPIMGAGGVIVPPEGYPTRIMELCKRHDVLYVSDEVVTAFGRLGHMFASKEVFDIQPDIITCAKGITSGYQPLGATIFSEEIYDVMSSTKQGRCFAHGFTYSGHPVACAAALKNIEIMQDEKICEHVREIGPYFEEKLATLAELPIVGDVRGSHFMLCVENVADKQTKEPFPDEANIGKRISDHAERLGLIVRPIGALNVISPPLILSRAQIDELVEMLGTSIQNTVDDLRKEGLFKR